MAECSSLTEECGGESEDAFIAMWQGKPELYGAVQVLRNAFFRKT